MSLVESFYKIQTNKLSDLVSNSAIVTEKKLFSKKTIDNFYTFLDNNSVQLADLDFKQFNGGVFLYVLTYLEDIAKINITKSDLQDSADIISKNRECTALLFTETTKTKYTEALSFEKFDVDKFKQYNSETYDDGDLETAEACIEVIKLLKKHIDSIKGPDEFVLFTLG